MSQPLDPKDLVTFKELLMANSIQVDALIQLLIEQGLISECQSTLKIDPSQP
jgi:hypothetical protein